MLQQLGSYYQKNGSRSRMSKDVGGSLLDKLKAAEASLPPVETQRLVIRLGKSSFCMMAMPVMFRVHEYY